MPSTTDSNTMGEKVKSTLNSAKESAADMAETVKEKTMGAANTAENKAHEMKGRAQQ